MYNQYNHAPPGYICPFCSLVQGALNEHVHSLLTDIVLQNASVTALISSHQWPRTRGHVIIIPNEHYENIYDLPLEVAADIHAVAKSVALAMKRKYGCKGISTRQHNEPAGNQDVWHYHLHVFPRYPNDGLYTSQGSLMNSGQRAIYAQKLRAAL